MDHIRLTNALTKAGATITGEGDRFRATKGTREIRWYTQEDWQKPGRMEAICVRWPSPQTDSSTDCFCDTYYDTIKGAVASLDR